MYVRIYIHTYRVFSTWKLPSARMRIGSNALALDVAYKLGLFDVEAAVSAHFRHHNQRDDIPVLDGQRLGSNALAIDVGAVAREALHPDAQLHRAALVRFVRRLSNEADQKQRYQKSVPWRIYQGKSPWREVVLLRILPAVDLRDESVAQVELTGLTSADGETLKFAGLRGTPHDAAGCEARRVQADELRPLLPAHLGRSALHRLHQRAGRAAPLHAAGVAGHGAQLGRHLLCLSVSVQCVHHFSMRTKTPAHGKQNPAKEVVLASPRYSRAEGKTRLGQGWRPKSL